MGGRRAPVNPNEEWRKLREDRAYFLTAGYAYYTEPPGRGRPPGVQCFEPWPWQVELFRAWQHGVVHPRSQVLRRSHVVLKSRQLGLTWLIALYLLATALVIPGTNALVVSYRQDAARLVVARIRLAFSRLPTWIHKTIRINDSRENVEFYLGDEKIAFSKITALPSTAEIGRSEASSIVVADEWGFHPFAEDNYPALRDSLGQGATFIGISTANLPSGTFPNTFKAAVYDDDGEFVPWFFGWKSHPDRDDEWYARTLQDKISTLGRDAGEKAMRREHPSTWQEAFVSAGSAVFDTKVLSDMLERARKNPPIHNDLDEGYRTWEEPNATGRYVMGADVAEGEADSDFSAATVREWRTGRHVATLRGRWPVRQFATKLQALGEEWNNALIGPERNGPGLAVITVLEDNHYPNLFYEVRETRDGNPEVKAGWTTSAATKPVMVAEMAEAIAGNEMSSYDEQLISEYMTYVRKTPKDSDVRVSTKSQPTGASRGEHDDLVMADMICWQMRNYYTEAPSLPAPYNVDDARAGSPHEEFEYLRTIRGGSRKLELMKKHGKSLPARLPPPYRA